MKSKLIDVAIFVAAVALAAAVTASAATPSAADAGPRLDQLPRNWLDDSAHETPLTGFVGHRLVLTMAYASCRRICPMTMRELERMQAVADARRESLEFVVIGYDPKNDSPAVWHRYRASRGLTRANWHFLSGSPDATRRLANQLGFPFWTMDDDHVMHESRAVLFDARGVQQTVLGLPTAHWVDAL